MYIHIWYLLRTSSAVNLAARLSEGWTRIWEFENLKFKLENLWLPTPTTTTGRVFYADTKTKVFPRSSSKAKLNIPNKNIKNNSSFIPKNRIWIWKKMKHEIWMRKSSWTKTVTTWEGKYEIWFCFYVDTQHWI